MDDSTINGNGGGSIGGRFDLGSDWSIGSNGNVATGFICIINCDLGSGLARVWMAGGQLGVGMGGGLLCAGGHQLVATDEEKETMSAVSGKIIW